MIELTDPENLMVQRMTRIWENFAQTGQVQVFDRFQHCLSNNFDRSPNNPEDEYLSDLQWPRHDSDDEYYLEIGNNMVEKNGLFLERYSVWDQLESSSSTSKISFIPLICLLVLKFLL